MAAKKRSTKTGVKRQKGANNKVQQKSEVAGSRTIGEDDADAAILDEAIRKATSENRMREIPKLSVEYNVPQDMISDAIIKLIRKDAPFRKIFFEEIIDPGDHLEQLADYLKKTERYDSASLAKCAPRTATRLLGGTIDADSVASKLCFLRNCANAGVIGSDVTNNGDSGDGHFYDFTDTDELEVYSSLVCEIAIMALPYRFSKFGRRHPEENETLEESWETFQSSFARELFQKISRINIGMEDENYLDTWIHELEKYCESLAKPMDKTCFQGRKGTFLRLCPVYKKDPHQLKEKIKETLENALNLAYSQNQEAFVQHLTDVVEGIACGIHLTDAACWECGKMCPSGIECNSCGIAHYCSQVCQAKAWSTGHNKACAGLPAKKAFLDDSLTTIEATYSSSNKIANLSLNPTLDYQLLDYLLALGCQRGNNDQATGSMASFYEALERASSKTWWPFDKPTKAQEEPRDILRCHRDILVKLSMQSALDIRLSEDEPCAVTVEEFLRFYNGFGRNPSRDIDRMHVHKQNKMKRLFHFRGREHKMSEDINHVEEDRDGGDDGSFSANEEARNIDLSFKLNKLGLDDLD